MSEQNTGLISDGYHTFNGLYEHRHALYVCLCKHLRHKGYDVWRSKKHSDLTRFNGWFILGVNRRQGSQITYHLPITEWKKCKFAKTLNHAPKYDGHTSKDVLSRINKISEVLA
jgi:hypothetical protein